MELKTWQALLPDNIPLSMINIPGTHDSSTQFVKLSPFSKCQNNSIGRQLETGTRFLDIRLELRESSFYAVHGIADCRSAKKRKSPLLLFDEIFRVLKVFVEKNPSETVIVLLNVGRGNNGETFFPAFQKQFIEQNSSIWFLENRIPALGECRGKLVLARRCGLGTSSDHFNDKNTGINFTNWPDQGSKKSFSALPCSIESTVGNAAAASAVIQDRYMFNPISKWGKVIKTVLENENADENTILINLFSTAGAPFIPRVNSKYINSKFTNCKLKSKKSYGWLILDFQTAAMNEKIINSNF